MRNHVQIGNKYGRLTVDSFSRRHMTQCGGYLNYWNCVCECGNRSEVTNRNLLSGHTLSCGCYLIDRLKECKTIHGFSRKGNVHQLHKVWRKILQRCNYTKDSSFHRYGGRGISVCERWKEFKNFISDMLPEWKPGLTIERKDNDGPYSPENCRWATQMEQCNNRRSNVFATINGERLTLAQWSRKSGIRRATIGARVKMGWPEHLLLSPVRHCNRTAIQL